MRRAAALLFAFVLFASAVPASASAAGPVVALPVPYRSQLDGNPYEESDCGPATMAMILQAYGKVMPTMAVRLYVNDVQGTPGMYDAGSFIESLDAVAWHWGLRPQDLFSGGRDAKGKPELRRWTFEDVKRHLDAGHPIVPQVWYRGLPGREKKPYGGDHYIVLTGYGDEGVIYNDPIDKDVPGANRRMSWAQLDKAWRNSDFPYAALAVAGSAERPSLLAPAPRPVVVKPTVTPTTLLRPAPRPLPGPGEMPLATFPGTWTPSLAGAD